MERSVKGYFVSYTRKKFSSESKSTKLVARVANAKDIYEMS